MSLHSCLVIYYYHNSFFFYCSVGFLHKANQYDILYKPVQAGNKGQREVTFYEGLFSLPEEELSRDLQRLKKLIPGYYGVCDITDRAGETCILFSKVLYVCVCVCVCVFDK